MSIAGIKNALSHIPGIQSLTMHYGASGTEIYTLGDKSVTLPANAVANEIENALTGTPRTVSEVHANLVAAAATITPLPAPVAYVPTPGKPAMSVTGLQSGAFQAALDNMKKSMADKQAAALAKIDGAVTSAGAQMDEAVAGVTAKVDKEIAAALQEFALTTNGGPA